MVQGSQIHGREFSNGGGEGAVFSFDEVDAKIKEIRAKERNASEEEDG